MVATPFLTTGVAVIEGRFPLEVSVQPKAFSDMLIECVKLWKDVGGDAAEVLVLFEKGAVTVRWTDGKSARSRSMPARQTG
ncbi:MAG: hypothetical protein ACK4MQ_00180 [Hyphomonas sp.]